MDPLGGYGAQLAKGQGRKPPPPSGDARWYVRRGEGTAGPIDEAEVIRWARNYQLEGALLARVGSADWVAAEESPLASFMGKRLWGFRRRDAVVGLGIVGACLLLTIFYVAREIASAQRTVPASPEITTTPLKLPEKSSRESGYDSEPQPRVPTLAERVGAATSLDDALTILDPHFDDTVNEVSGGAAVLAVWAAHRLRWSELMRRPETSFRLVMKDSVAERGKRLCARGTINEIAVDRSAGVAIYNGGLVTPSMKVMRYLAVGDTGNLVEDSPARFCGVVVGRLSYMDVTGGSTHAVQLVGMFDLPENRRAREQR